VVERQPSKLRVAGSNPVSRSTDSGEYIENRKFLFILILLSTNCKCPCSSVGRAHPW
jgi:hypothetical protein